jgi:amidohydrolase
MAILLVAAKVMASKRSTMRGTLKLIFQPAEEGGGGGRVMTEEGCLDPLSSLSNLEDVVAVDEVYALHVWNLMRPGLIGVRSGPVMANSDRVFFKVRGRGGHAGAPHHAVDPVLASSHLVVALHSIVSRNVNPLKSAVLSVNMIHSGTAANIIPEVAELTASVRSYDPDVRDLMERRIGEVCRGIEQSFNVQVEMNYGRNYPSTVNTPEQTKKVETAARKIVGDANTRSPNLFMGGEDFAFMLLKRPGCFFFVGSAPNAKSTVEEDLIDVIAHHCEQFDIREDPTLAVGASVWLQLFEDLLCV